MGRWLCAHDAKDTSQLSPKDALLRWVELNTAGHDHVDIKSFKNSFSDGFAFCALIHKFKPELINYAALDPADPLGNLKVAMDAAEKFFALEQYLAPADIPKLDDKSMLVYVSEYYSGITEQRKLDLAARRIAKLVDFTRVNDTMKASYVSEAEKMRAEVQTGETLLLNSKEVVRVLCLFPDTILMRLRTTRCRVQRIVLKSSKSFVLRRNVIFSSHTFK